MENFEEQQSFIKERSAAAIGFFDVKEMLAACAVSPSGREAALELEPSAEQDVVRERLAETKEAETIVMSKASHPIMSFMDVSREISRLRSQANLNNAELININLLQKAAKRAASMITTDEERNIVLLPKLAEELFYDSGVINRIEACIISEEEIADDASPELRSIRRKIRSENDSIKEKLNNIIRSREYGKYLQEAIITQRNGRYVVPVKAECKGAVPGLVHDISASGATLFIEPMAVVEANNQLKELESSGMKSFMKELRPRCLEDLIAGIALYRPGPMDFIPQYIKGKNLKFKERLLPSILEF